MESLLHGLNGKAKEDPSLAPRPAPCLAGARHPTAGGLKPSGLFVRLAVQHMGHRPVRTALLALAIAVGGGAVFVASALRQAIQQSLGMSLSRLGADLMVVPRETTVNLTAALLCVEPTPHTLDGAILERIAHLPGVQLAAPQRYFCLPVNDRHHSSEELIAFDPDRDISVQPWLTEKLDRAFRRGDVIVGARRTENIGTELHLFGYTLTVYGKLGLTGVGPFERSTFVSFATAADIARAARQTTGRSLLDAEPDRFSAVLVRLDAGGTPEQFRFALASLGGVQIVAGNGLSTSVRQGMTRILDGVVLFTILALLSTALMVGTLYTGLLAERRRELGLLLAVGMRPGQLARLILAEAALTTALGGLCGVLLGAAVLVLVQRSLGYSFAIMQIPFTLPPAGDLAITALLSVLVCGAVGVLGALVPAWRSGQREPYDLVRGEGA